MKQFSVVTAASTVEDYTWPIIHLVNKWNLKILSSETGLSWLYGLREIYFHCKQLHIDLRLNLNMKPKLKCLNQSNPK